jgi:hypothetical protein
MIHQAEMLAPISPVFIMSRLGALLPKAVKRYEKIHWLQIVIIIKTSSSFLTLLEMLIENGRNNQSIPRGLLSRGRLLHGAGCFLNGPFQGFGEHGESMLMLEIQFHTIPNITQYNII